MVLDPNFFLGNQFFLDDFLSRCLGDIPVHNAATATILLVIVVANGIAEVKNRVDADAIAALVFVRTMDIASIF